MLVHVFHKTRRLNLQPAKFKIKSTLLNIYICIFLHVIFVVKNLSNTLVEIYAIQHNKNKYSSTSVYSTVYIQAFCNKNSLKTLVKLKVSFKLFIFISCSLKFSQILFSKFQ